MTVSRQSGGLRPALRPGWASRCIVLRRRSSTMRLTRWAPRGRKVRPQRGRFARTAATSCVRGPEAAVCGHGSADPQRKRRRSDFCANWGTHSDARPSHAPASAQRATTTRSSWPWTREAEGQRLDITFPV